MGKVLYFNNEVSSIAKDFYLRGLSTDVKYLIRYQKLLVFIRKIKYLPKRKILEKRLLENISGLKHNIIFNTRLYSDIK